ncbi:transporter substrate-binding domain-containing protein [Streptococcus dentiloxodontae]
MRKYLLGALMLTAIIILSACSSSSGTKVEDIKNNGKIVVATESEFAPFEFKTLINGKDELVGADIELAKAIGDKLGVEVEFSVMSFNNVLASLQSGKADIAIAGISVTDERKNIYDFSDSYYESENVVIIKKTNLNTYTSISSLSKQSIGAQKGSIQETTAKDQFQDSSIVSLTSNGEMINELKSGQLQAVVLEKAIAEGYIAQNDDLTLANFSLKSDGTDAYAVAVSKGSDELLEQINQVITEVKSSGKFDQWLAKASTYTQVDSSDDSSE